MGRDMYDLFNYWMNKWIKELSKKDHVYHRMFIYHKTFKYSKAFKLYLDCSRGAKEFYFVGRKYDYI